MSNNIVIVADEASVSGEIEELAQGEGFGTIRIAAAEARVNTPRAPIVMIDCESTEGASDILKKLKEKEEETFCVALTANDAGEPSPDADVILPREMLRPLVPQTLTTARRQLELDDIFEWRDANAPFLLGSDPATDQLLRTLRRVANTAVDVLVTGESGVGKEVIARAIHNASDRRDKPFVPLNCAAIPKDLVESELFGHSRGAFSGAHDKKLGKFQYADGGTLFLDEIGELELPVQAKFLRVIQERSFTPVGDNRQVETNVRIVAATNQDLGRQVDRGKFRQDLYYRLKVIPLEVKPLRDRPKDVVQLAQAFVAEANGRHGRRIRGFTRRALDALTGYGWPGNVRELRNLIERLVVLKIGDSALDLRDLPPEITPVEPANGGEGLNLDPGNLSLQETLAQVELKLTKEALARANGNKAKAAEILGLKRTTLVERLKKLEHRNAANGSTELRRPPLPMSND